MLRYRDELPEDRRRRLNRERAATPPDLVVEAPVTVGLYLDALEKGGERDLAAAILAGFDLAATAAAQRLQADAGQVGLRPVTLQIQRDRHRFARDHQDVSRPHLHLQVARLAIDEHGRAHEVDLAQVRNAAPVVQAVFQDAWAEHIERVSPARFVPATTAAGKEIAGIPADLIARFPRQRCPAGGPQLYPLDRYERSLRQERWYA